MHYGGHIYIWHFQRVSNLVFHHTFIEASNTPWQSHPKPFLNNICFSNRDWKEQLTLKKCVILPRILTDLSLTIWEVFKLSEYKREIHISSRPRSVIPRLGSVQPSFSPTQKACSPSTLLLPLRSESLSAEEYLSFLDQAHISNAVWINPCVLMIVLTDKGICPY